MTTFTEKFEAAFAKLNNAIAGGVALSVGLFTVLVPLDFFVRKLNWGSLEWLNESATYFLYIGVFLSATWVLQQGAHVRVDIILSLLPPKAAATMERGIDLAGMVLCLIMAYLGSQSTLAAYALGSLPDKDLRIPNWIILVIFTVSFLLLAIEFLLRYHRAGLRGYVAEESVGF